MSQIDLSLGNLLPNEVVPTLVDYEGSEAVRLVLTSDAETPDNPTFARIKDVEFRNGTIEIEVAGRRCSETEYPAKNIQAIIISPSPKLTLMLISF